MTARTESSQSAPSAASDVPRLAKFGSDLTFIETQFPVSKLSRESYRERKSPSQTLTGLGKWWGRKPLVLCRATIMGLLLPATDNPKKDRDIFLKLMTMDDDGMLRRKSKSIPLKKLFQYLPPREREHLFVTESSEGRPKYKKGTSRADKEALQRRVFLSLSYDERLDYCARPEQIEGPSEEAWQEINDHLSTTASSLPDLVTELGKRRFGHVPRIGDAFCGGGSVPFEAARIGCYAYGADLNPVAALLTWGAVNIAGADQELIERVHQTQKRVYEALDRRITEWGIEHRDPDPKTGRRWRADAYLYCVEVTCPECGWRVPLAPSWVIAEKTNVVAELVPEPKNKRYRFNVRSGALAAGLKEAKNGTVADSELVCPNCLRHQPGKARTPIDVIRGDGRGTFGDSRSLLRGWDNSDVVPRSGDIFGERLYCVRWLDQWTESDNRGNAKLVYKRHYMAPTEEDLCREETTLQLLLTRFDEWQQKGFLPVRRIEPGYNTNQPIRERGWTHWHHLFAPRQLLLLGSMLEIADELITDSVELSVALMLRVAACADWNSRLCRWIASVHHSGGIGSLTQTYYNQALNTLYNFGVRPTTIIKSTLTQPFPQVSISGCASVQPVDARGTDFEADIWLTDPPYADAINYEEVTEFFLAWYDAKLVRVFPAWYSDSKRALAVKGKSQQFRQSMRDCYKRLSDRMDDNGFQVVMFTHQDAHVWADLALILWSAGLSVTSAWCIATETGVGIKEGNYVQGTVLLVLRKRTESAGVFLDEVYQDVEVEVRRQLDSMLALDEKDDPNFGDTDYQLAAYAAALRVLTCRPIEDIDVTHELSKTRQPTEKSKVEELIENAVRIACDHLVPRGIASQFWKLLAPPERFYLKGIEIESHGEYRSGVYQELGRGFRLDEYTPLLASTKANQTRLKTASEFGRRELGPAGFGSTLVRHALFATYKTTQADSTREGLQWLHDEVNDYWASRERLIAILNFLAGLGKNASMDHWHADAHAAALMAGAVRNDHV